MFKHALFFWSICWGVKMSPNSLFGNSPYCVIFFFSHIIFLYLLAPNQETGCARIFFKYRLIDSIECIRKLIPEQQIVSWICYLLLSPECFAAAVFKMKGNQRKQSKTWTTESVFDKQLNNISLSSWILQNSELFVQLQLTK